MFVPKISTTENKIKKCKEWGVPETLQWFVFISLLTSFCRPDESYHLSKEKLVRKYFLWQSSESPKIRGDKSLIFSHDKDLLWNDCGNKYDLYLGEIESLEKEVPSSLDTLKEEVGEDDPMYVAIMANRIKNEQV